MACAVSFSFSIYFPYLRSTVVTSQIICDVIDVHHDANKPSISYKFDRKGFADSVASSAITGSSHSQLTTSLITPSNLEVSPEGQTALHSLSNVHPIKRNYKTSHCTPRTDKRRPAAI